MEPMAPMGVSSTAVAVDGGGGNGFVPTAINGNDNTMALVAMAPLTNGGSGMAAIGKGKGGSTSVVASAVAEAEEGGTWQQNWSNQRSIGKLINFSSP